MHWRAERYVLPACFEASSWAMQELNEPLRSRESRLVKQDPAIRRRRKWAIRAGFQ